MGNLEGKRYSPLDRDEVHQDMKVDPQAVARSVAAQPAVADAHRGCSACAELTPSKPTPPTRVGKVRLTLAQLAEIFDLPDGLRPIRMYVTNDPHDLVVVVEGEALEQAPLGGETPLLPT